jgi:serine/threonine-protein kinase
MDIAAPTRDLWIYDWARDTQSRLTNGPSDNSSPVWSPDGRSIAYSARIEGRFYNLAVIPSDGTRPPQRLLTAKEHQIAGSWHPSGKYLAYGQQSPDTGFDLMILPLERNSAMEWKPGTPTVFLKTPAVEQNPEFSPDGRWLAYQSDESGRGEAYVRTFPNGDRKWQISSAGGGYPVWSPTGHSLFYGMLDGQIMEVPFTVAGDVFQPEKPRPWSPVRFSTGLYRRYDIHPDGKRFAIAKSAQEGQHGDEVTLVFNLFNELRRLTAAVR